jgi:Flp pilus assembly protein TadD
MSTPQQEEAKRGAFRLFEEGKYQESLEICTGLPPSERDPAVEILVATNLYYTGKSGDAEVCFRDLLQKMPDSSYAHSYLGKILGERGDGGAITEYATAVHLDPTNQDALQSYAEYLLSQEDFRGALPVLRRLVEQGKKPADVRKMMRVLIETGDPEGALTLHKEAGGGDDRIFEYIDALAQTRNYRLAAEAALRIFRKTRDIRLLRRHLDLLSRYDVPAAIAAYAAHTQSGTDNDILADYILLLKSAGDCTRALELSENLISRSQDVSCRLVRADLLAALGRQDEALAAYEQLVRDGLGTKDDMDTLGLVIRKYWTSLLSQLPPDTAAGRFLSLVSRDINVASLLETGRFYETLGNETEARAWYYRAYRTDYLTGGLGYARFLSAHGEDRECEKVMLYILSNVKRGDDLVYVG